MAEGRNNATKFKPRDCKSLSSDLHLPDEVWMTILDSPCTFPPDVFSKVMLNLIKNPNVTSSHLFRADIFYDSAVQPTLSHQHRGVSTKDDLINHLKAEYRPLDVDVPGYMLERTMVRQLVPRNPQVDKPLIQTCHFFQRHVEDVETNVVVYIPHVQAPDEMPFYHPTVARLAFCHRWSQISDTVGSGSISISSKLFEHTDISVKLERTALKLLQTVHKHGQGQLAGYQKRVHLDQVIPQKRYQDTYTRLKSKYGAKLAKEWVEVTDPGKHVFEDIAIAAWLIELWADIYGLSTTADGKTQETSTTPSSKSTFPGFVDIGCGNGILVSILLSEGYRGWGFDARQRKTWSIFESNIQAHLEQRLLVPKILQEQSDTNESMAVWHDGTFDKGTFIISNHADELTLWTPLLAYQNDCAFVAIPCCSHDFSGARFRAPLETRSSKGHQPSSTRLPQQDSEPRTSGMGNSLDQSKKQYAETGSLSRTNGQKSMPSAYASLCSYLESLAKEVGFEPERDVLRIPSTRNSCIIGRQWTEPNGNCTTEEKQKLIKDIIERESGKTLAKLAEDWISRAKMLSLKPSSGH